MDKKPRHLKPVPTPAPGSLSPEEALLLLRKGNPTGPLVLECRKARPYLAVLSRQTLAQTAGPALSDTPSTEPGIPSGNATEALDDQPRSSDRTVTATETRHSHESAVTFPPNQLPHAKPHSPDKRDLRAAYLAANYVFEAEGHSYALRIGEQNRHVRDLLARHDAQGATFITAFNPASLPLGEAHNGLAMRAPRQDLNCGNGQPKAVYEGAGQDLAGAWLPGPSLMLVGTSRAHAEKLGRRYGQYAIVWIDEAGMPTLVELADLDRTSRLPRPDEDHRGGPTS